MKNKMLKRSIFTKTIVLFCVVVLPIYLIGFFISKQSREILIQYYSEAVHKQVSGYFSVLESDLKRIEKMQYSLQDDEDVNRLMMLSMQEFDYDVSDTINKIFTQLRTIQMSSDNIEKITLYFPKLGRSLKVSSSSSKYDELSDVSDMPSLGEYEQAGNLFYHDEKFYMLALPAFSNDLTNDNTFLIEIELSTNNILESLNQYNIIPEGISLLRLQNDNTILSLSEHKRFTENLDLSEMDVQNTDGLWERIWMEGDSYLKVSLSSSYLGADYIQLIPERQALQSLQKLDVWYILLTIVALLAILIYTALIYIMFKRPMDLLIWSFKEVEREHFDTQIKESGNGEFSVVYDSFNQMVLKIKHLIDVVYTEKLLNEKSKLRQLQAQINPHFLYNSFYILRNRIKKRQYENAEQFCQMLGTYFNYITRNYDNYATLSQEVHHAQVYAQIQAIRFSPRIQVDFQELDPQYAKVIVPRLVLQPIIENAFKYGLEQMESNGKLKVSFDYADPWIRVIVEDNGGNENQTEKNLEKIRAMFADVKSIKEPTGLLNIHQRIQLFSSEKCGLQFSKSSLGGLKVTLTLWLNQERQDD